MNSDNNTNTNSQSNDGVKGTYLLGPTLVNPWVGQGGFRTRFQTVDNCRPLSRFMVSPLSLMWMASVVLCQ